MKYHGLWQKSPDIFRNAKVIPDPAGNSDLRHELMTVKALGLCYFFKNGMHFDQYIIIHHLAGIGDGKERLNARRGIGDDGESSGGGNGGDRGVSDHCLPSFSKTNPRNSEKGHAALPIAETPRGLHR